MNYLIFTLTVFHLIGEYESIHAKWKHYADVTTKQCGIGYKSALAENSCFKWLSGDVNKQTMKNIRNGRNAMFGEYPWVVFITIVMEKGTEATCTGSLVNGRWIITAAHCFSPKRTTSPSNVKVRIGSNNKYESKPYDVEDIFQHPYYIDLIVSLGKHRHHYYHNNDIALIKLKQNVVFDQTNDYYITNSICLPEKFIINTEYEYATIAGFGRINPAGHVQSVLKTGALRILPFGRLRSLEVVFENDPIYLIDYNGDDIMAFQNDTNYPLTCMGDSGGPVFQFDNGRAVLIGIIGNNKNTDVVPYAYCKPSIAILTRVSKKIDWILRTIQNNDD